MNSNINEAELKLLAYLHEQARGYTEDFMLRTAEIIPAIGIGEDQLKKDLSYLKAHGLAGMKVVNTTAINSKQTSFLLVGLWLTGEGEDYMRELENRLADAEKEAGAPRKITLVVVQEGWAILKGIAINLLSEMAKSRISRG